eukprot:GHVN01106896.1.p1 GENE.GHVN01106896.1~~GHVN01106896.1.p1  ORF type:complete len:380 (-),score=51.27 GHVN01106896.1:60-1199(-)
MAKCPQTDGTGDQLEESDGRAGSEETRETTMSTISTSASSTDKRDLATHDSLGGGNMSAHHPSPELTAPQPIPDFGPRYSDPYSSSSSSPPNVINAPSTSREQHGSQQSPLSGPPSPRSLNLGANHDDDDFDIVPYEPASTSALSTISSGFPVSKFDFDCFGEENPLIARPGNAARNAWSTSPSHTHCEGINDECAVLVCDSSGGDANLAQKMLTKLSARSPHVNRRSRQQGGSPLHDLEPILPGSKASKQDPPPFVMRSSSGQAHGFKAERDMSRDKCYLCKKMGHHVSKCGSNPFNSSRGGGVGPKSNRNRKGEASRPASVRRTDLKSQPKYVRYMGNNQTRNGNNYDLSHHNSHRRNTQFDTIKTRASDSSFSDSD